MSCIMQALSSNLASVMTPLIKAFNSQAYLGPSAYDLVPAHTGAPLPSSSDDPKLQAPGYDVFKGVQLAKAYNWSGCPDDIPDGPVALSRTPQVPHRFTHYTSLHLNGTPAGRLEHA